MLGGAGKGGNEAPYEQLTRYIPVETITLFVAAMSLAGAGVENAVGTDVADPEALAKAGWWLYGLFALLVTPLITFLVAKRQYRSDPPRDANGNPLPFRTPWWPIFLAVLAFAGWALAVPGLLINDFQKVAAAFVATLISMALSLLDGAFG
jgi:hypothetical protein